MAITKKYILLPLWLMLICVVSLSAQQPTSSAERIKAQCQFIWDGGEYLMQHKGKVSNMDSLLQQVQDIDLRDTTVVAFMKAHRPVDFADYYYMFQALKRGEPFDAARDGLGFTTRFPFRALNQNDYAKLREVFSAPHPLLHEPYMQNIEFAFQNRGCTEGLAAIRPLIEQQVADSPGKQRLLKNYDEYGKLRKGCMAPLSEFKDSEGNVHTFAELRGKVVVVDVWATWCHSCLQRMPHFLELSRQWSHRQDIAFVTLSIDRNKSFQAWLNAIEKHQIKGTINWRADIEGGSSFESDYKIVGIPRYFVLDAEGKIVSLYADFAGEELETLLNALCGEQQGIRFEELTLPQALEKAGREGKRVFIDCYTQSCGPCKYMAREIFPMKECGDYFNPLYVSLKRDMEKGEGIEIAQKYGVKVYPTFLILNPDGSLFCVETGATTRKSERTFVQKMQEAVEKVELEQQYQAGNRQPEFLRSYVALLQRTGNGNLPQVVNELLMPLSTPQLCLTENWQLIDAIIQSTDDPLFARLLKERKLFIKKLGREPVEAKIMRTYAEEFRIYKRMGLDFDKRIASLKALEKEGYAGALKLRYAMWIRQVIDGKQKELVGEVIALLRTLPKEIKAEKDRMEIVAELNRIENVATPVQKQEIADQLKELEQSMTIEDYRLSLQRMRARLLR